MRKYTGILYFAHRMRFFAEISYQGTAYAGWQRQDNALTIQQVIEDALTTLLQERISILGCGRTDAGVHARQFFFHFDMNPQAIDGLEGRLNRFLPKDIAVHRIIPVEHDVHARFDATSRTYQYFLSFVKDPFTRETAYYFPFKDLTKTDLLPRSAELLLNYDSFFPFCKTNSDADHYRCELTQAKWTIDENEAVFTISSNRFLRGMVRLIVGMCLQVGRGKLELNAVREALERQVHLRRSDSAPAHGLHLTAVRYPFLLGQDIGTGTRSSG